MVESLAWQSDLEWLRRPLPVFPAIYPWTVIGFLTTALVIILLALAVKTGSARCEWAGKVLAVTLGLVVSVFLLEYALSRPVSAFDRLLFPHILHRAGGSFPGRPAPQTCETFFMMAVEVLIFDRWKRRIEAFQIATALVMFWPCLAILGYVLFASVFQSLGGKPTTEMAVPTGGQCHQIHGKRGGGGPGQARRRNCHPRHRSARNC